MLSKFILPLGAAALVAAAPALHERCPTGNCAEVPACVEGNCAGTAGKVEVIEEVVCYGPDCGTSSSSIPPVPLPTPSPCVTGDCGANVEVVEVVQGAGCPTGNCGAVPPHPVVVGGAGCATGHCGEGEQGAGHGVDCATGHCGETGGEHGGVEVAGCPTGDCGVVPPHPEVIGGAGCATGHCGEGENQHGGAYVDGCVEGNCGEMGGEHEAGPGPVCIEGNCGPDMTGPHPELITQAVVWIDEAGAIICTITETITAQPTVIPPPPPPPAEKIVEEAACEECVETQVRPDTTTIYISPVPATPTPSPIEVVDEICELCEEINAPKPAPPAPEVVVDCGVEGGCEQPPAPAPPAPMNKEVVVDCGAEGGCEHPPMPPAPPAPEAVVDCGVEGGCEHPSAPAPPAPAPPAPMNKEVSIDCGAEGGCEHASGPVVIAHKSAGELAPVSKVVKVEEESSGSKEIFQENKSFSHSSSQSYESSSGSATSLLKPKQGSGSSGGVVPKMGNTHGISYAAYRGDHGCKTEKDINDDFEDMEGKYSVIRTYGVDCGQVPIIYEAAKKHGMKIFFGIWDLNKVEYEAEKLIEGINKDWEIVHSVSVGNELVNNGEATAEQVISAVKQARSILRAAGYEGPVVAVDTFIAVEKNLSLCEESDYCAINAHAFFDSTISASEAGPWLVKTVDSIRSKLGSDKKIIVTETGWPTQGQGNGKAVPGIANQKMALDSISKSFSSNPGEVFFFSAFNDLWKGEADKYWGIAGATSRCDQ